MNKSGFLPSRFAVNDPLSPLGRLVVEVKPQKADPFSSFEKGSHERYDETREHAPAAPVAAPPSPVDAFCEKHSPPAKFKVGDRVRVIAQCSFRGFVGHIKAVYEKTYWIEGVLGTCHVVGFASVEIVEAAPESPPKTEANGWIEWKGGECPVQPTTPVLVQFRDGGVCDEACACIWRWDHFASPSDIVAYRVLGK